MPIALTNSRIIYRQFEATTAAAIAEAVNATLQACGWVSTAVTGGYRLQGASPQGLNIYLYVRDLGHSLFGVQQCTFNFSSIDGLYVGMDHEVQPGTGIIHQIVAGSCYLWVSIVGDAYDIGGTHFCGGIPFLPGAAACGAEVPADAPPSQSFWAMGDGDNDLGPRSSLILNHTMSQSEALWGTDYCAPGNTVGSLRIPTLAPSPAFGGFNFPSPTLWRNGDFFVFEPLLVWGLSNSALPKIRAQIYDAMIFSKQTAMDVRRSRSVDGTVYNFVNFTDQYLYGGLNLIVPTGSFIEGNYAYIAT